VETHTVVAGTGYTAGRVLAVLGPARATGFSRSAAAGPGLVRLDLDRADATPPPLPTAYTLLYTIPPAHAGDDDSRLARLLSMLDPRPARFVYLSTSGVYGDCGGELVAEARQPRPETARASRRLAAERRLQGWTAAYGAHLVILRVPGIYGPGRLGVDRIRAGTPVIREADAHPGNRIQVDDLVSGCIAALSPARPAGIYNLGDGDHRSSTWFTGTVARLAGLPAPPDVSREEARRTFPPGRLSFLEESRRLDTRKMREVLGVVPRYANAEDGVRASLDADGLLKH
jgi:nucleoside-diphosphate-sugar epimerase